MNKLTLVISIPMHMPHVQMACVLLLCTGLLVFSYRLLLYLFSVFAIEVSARLLIHVNCSCLGLASQARKLLSQCNL